jgi:hypothetical protein
MLEHREQIVERSFEAEARRGIGRERVLRRGVVAVIPLGA